jgi:hypothetical protein
MSGTLGTPLAFPFGTNENCAITALTQDEILDLFARVTSPSWLDPIKSGAGPGYEMLQAYAQVLVRASTAVEHLACGAYILTSFGGRKATVIVRFTRSSALAGQVTVKTGTVITTSKGDRRFVTSRDAILTFGGSNDLFVDVPAEAVASGWQWNVPGQVTAANGEILPGEIDTIVSLDTDPPFGDPTIRVEQIAFADGGQAPMLDGLGDDRGLIRHDGETDDQYKFRIRTLPDTVSPDAMKRSILAYLKQVLINPTFDFIETFELRYQTCWDANQVSLVQVATPGSGTFDPNLFCYDDPRPIVPFRNRWLDETEARGAFIVVLPLFTLHDIGMAYDDTALTPQDLLIPGTVNGQRAVNAYDVTSALNPAILQGSYDGFDFGAAAVNRGLFDLLQSIKPAGVAAIIERQGE